jgi:ubiquitin-like-conjugating enzyme ATG10
MGHRAVYASYPYLTQDEFAETCHYLDRKYCRALLGPIRKKWRLYVHSALDLGQDPSSGSNFITYLQITRPLDDSLVVDDLASQMDNFSLGSDEPDDSVMAADHVMMEMEGSDKVRLCSSARPHSSG